MQWLKTWLRKWLGIESGFANWHRDQAELMQGADVLRGELVKIGVRIENLREHYASIKEMGDACMARLDRETTKLATAINGDRTVMRAELLDIVKLGERDEGRISELELLIKDATIDTTLTELEDRVAKLEATPIPSGPQGRRGGSAWGPHQAAAAAGAARASGSEVPIPVPGIS